MARRAPLKATGEPRAPTFNTSGLRQTEGVSGLGLDAQREAIDRHIRAATTGSRSHKRSRQLVRTGNPRHREARPASAIAAKAKSASGEIRSSTTMTVR